MSVEITKKQEEVLNTMCYGAKQVLLGTVLKELLERGGGGSSGGSGIKQITIEGVPLIVKDETVEIPAATANSLGLVKSGGNSGNIIIDSTGEIIIKKVPLSLIVQEQGEILIIDGGNSTS